MCKEEPEVIINGIDMGPGCAFIIRVAIEVLANHLIESGVGYDDHVKAMMDSITDIRRAMGVIK